MDLPDYQKVQLQFANYIRDPASNSLPAGVEQRRMDIYKRLFFNNLASFCAKSFKSFRRFVEDDEWNSLIRGFMREHSCTSPYFKDIPIAFVEYLESSNLKKSEFPFMREMCHLDAMKMQLRLAPDAQSCENLDITDRTAFISLSSTVRLLSYEWPVQKITPSTWDKKKPSQPTWLVAYRDPNDVVDVLVANVHTFRVLEVLKIAKPLEALTTQLCEEFSIPLGTLAKKLVPTIQAFNKKGVILTTRKA